MPTITDTLTQLGQDLRDAVASVLGLRSDMQTLRDTTVNNATTVINNFVYRAPSVDLFVDPANGSDANDGLTYATSKKTIDGALALLRIDTPANINLFGDVVMRGRYSVYNSLTITGLDVGGGVLGAPYRYVVRNISFASEATVSPAAGYGRILPGLFFLGPYLQFRSVTVTLPDATSVIDTPIVVINSGGGQIAVVDSTIAASTASTKAIFLSTTAIKFVTTFVATIGQNAAGKIFYQVAAGQNPNSNVFYDTNLTSA